MELKTIRDKIWNDPVWSKVIAGLIVLLVAGIASYFFPSIPAFLGREVTLPVWLIALIILPLLTLSIPTLKSTITNLFTDKSSNDPITTKPDFFDYTHDHILGVVWEWSWRKSRNTIRGYVPDKLQPRCPKCKSILSYSDYSDKLVYCIKDDCDWKWSNPRKRTNSFENVISHPSRLRDYVVTEIDRKVQTEEWKSADD